MDLSAFAADVGGVDAGPVCVAGGRSQWDVGGRPEPGTREVEAPAGVVSFEPAEMIVRCGAGTTVAELDAALGAHGQRVALPAWTSASTVGGVLAVGRSGLRRLGDGPVRDTLLEVRYVSAEGTVVKAGAPVVKNVSGYDVCRLMVGSLGTLGCIGEVVLRSRPSPASSRWLSGEADPFAVRGALHRPIAILWDGTTTWVCLEGHPADVVHETRVLARLGSFVEVGGPPPLSGPGRESVRPRELRRLEGEFLAEIGVGVVHRPHPVPPPRLPGDVVALHERVKALFDPTRRLNPGRVVA